MKFYSFLVIATLFAVINSCTIDKTDFAAELNQEVTEHLEFKEAVNIKNDDYTLSIEALNGTFYKGYNEIRLTIVNSKNNQPVHSTQVTFLPILTASNTNTSCPHSYNLTFNSKDNYYTGYVVFTNESTAQKNWKIYLDFYDNNQQIKVNKEVTVKEQTNMNLNMTSFTGKDGIEYYIALMAPQKPKVAENKLKAGIFKYNTPTTQKNNFPDPSQYSFSKVEKYTLLLDPRMPEPSMGNHSSPNNVDLTQGKDGFYHGVVNYTMTGKWTLNFIMLNQNEETIKGTEVPTDFTPGIEGAKSELHINILF